MSTDANSVRIAYHSNPDLQLTTSQKSAQATVMEPPVYAETIDQDTGPNSSFVPKNLPLQANQSPYESVSQQNTGASIASSTNPFRRSSGATAPASASKNPFSHTREISSGSAHGAPEKVGATSHIRQISADKGTSSHVRNLSNGSPRGSPRRERFPDMDPFTDGSSERRSIDKGYRGEFGEGSKSSGLRRNSSLKERFPGDKSVRPLDVLKEEDRKAYRAPHLKKRHIPGADTIDSLDEAIGGRYHHEGPYDATLLARNTSFTSSPVAALKTTNEEALRATPEEAIKDSLTRHRPLDNVAAFAPGETDSMGRRYNYEESDNMNIAEGGNLGRLDGVVR
jgi:hypothetical protein